MNPSYTTQVLALPSSPDGALFCTLISSNNNTRNRKSVLYIHGFTDYFFQYAMGDRFNQEGYDFYAIDLKRHGRSLTKEQKPNFCASISDFFEDIDAGIQTIYGLNNTTIYLLGHSNGGLVCSHYMAKGKERQKIKALLLNAPFFNFPLGNFLNMLSYWTAKIVSSIAPNASLRKGVTSVYPKSIHKEYYGEWEFDFNKKPLEGFPIYFSWVKAIIEAQKALSSLSIKVPVLVLYSNQSAKPKEYSPKVKQADIILDVEDIKRIVPSIKATISMVEIPNAMHDVFLSEKAVREYAYGETFAWLLTHE